MKKILTILLLALPFIGFNQQGRNIDLKEVVNTAAVIPKIEIDNLLYAMRDRDEIIAELLRSTFWLKSFKFSLNLEDYETGNKYNYENEGQVRIFVNDNELTKRHLFKTYKAIASRACRMCHPADRKFKPELWPADFSDARAILLGHFLFQFSHFFRGRSRIRKRVHSFDQ